MNLTHFEWLLFDFDNTLVDFNASSKEAFVKVMTPLIDQDPKELYPIYNKINHLCWDEREAGLISHDELKVKRWNMFFDKIDIKYDPLTANNIYFEVIKTNPYWIDGAVDLLKAIQDKYRSFIITNGLSEVQNPRAEILGLAEYFEHIIISDEIGIAKPQKGFFDHCDKLMGYPDPSKVLVIGDTLKSDVKGGNDFGYATCWYNYYKKENDTEITPDYVVEDLKSLGDYLGVF